MWRNPIYDRTLTDVQIKALKAYFNLVDWTRIYENADVVHNMINWLIDADVTFTTITVPLLVSIPDVSDFNILLENMERVRLAAPDPEWGDLKELRTDWSEGNRVESPNYEDVNDWERNLYILRYVLLMVADQMLSCGVFAVGQSRVWQKRFRRYNWGTLLYSSFRYTRSSLSNCGQSLTLANKFRG